MGRAFCLLLCLMVPGACKGSKAKTCPADKLTVYRAAGCAGDAEPGCVTAMPPCAEQFCSCTGVTVPGCRAATVPFRHAGPAHTRADGTRGWRGGRNHRHLRKSANQITLSTMTAGSDATRQALLRGAAQLAERNGVGGIGLREAARLAGVTHGAPYRHFDSREALVVAVAVDGFERLLASCVAAQAAPGRQALDRFKAVGVSYVMFARHNPGVWRVMFGSEAAGAPQVRAAEAAVFALAVSAVASAQASGDVEAGNPQELAFFAWSVVHGLTALMLDGLTKWVGISLDTEEAVGKFIASRVFNGLRAKK